MTDEILKIVIGSLCIISGPYLVLFYQKLKKENKAGGLSFKFQAVGIGLFIGGIILVIKAFVNLSLL